MWATGSIAGPRCTGSMRLVSTGWRSRRAAAGGRYHGVADEGVPFREIAEVIGRRLKCAGGQPKRPEEAAEHFGWSAHSRAMDCPASSQANAANNWDGVPTQPGADSRSRSGEHISKLEC